MPTLVSSIDDVFAVEGVGTVICLPKEEHWALPATEAIHSKERIQIRKPDGQIISTFIKEIVSMNRGRERGSVAFLLPSIIEKSDVPDGSVLWLERNGSVPMLADATCK